MVYKWYPYKIIFIKLNVIITYIDMLLDTAIYIASLFPEAWYGLTLIHREFAEYSKTRAGILKYRELFTKVEIKYDDKYIRIFGKLNSIKDKPAIIRANGYKHWYINGNHHRENDQPASIHTNGDKYWYINDKYHRENDKPAIIEANGDKYWLINDKRHRENDQPAVILANGDKAWYINDKLHRENDQPAIILANGYKRWCINGKFIK
jgi:hypothetical protein